MEKLEQARLEMYDVLAGSMKANDACEIVQHWIQLSCYDLAYSVATHSTKQGRAGAMEIIKTDSPEFYDDVKSMAKAIYNKNT